MDSVKPDSDSYISIHALLAESDGSPQELQASYIFLSTLSLRRATVAIFRRSFGKFAFLSTLSLRRATKVNAAVLSGLAFLSTLSLRRATDDTAVARLVLEVFLSTLSLRRATWTTSAAARPPANFYPRSPCGERPSDGAHPFLPGNFYPRSPCGERRVCADLLGVATGFLSTLSLRRATAFSATCPWA